MMLTNRFSKICELCPEKCGYVQGGTGKHGKVGSTNNFLVLEDTTYDILIGLPTMIQSRARPEYYRIVLKIHYGGDSEILNYEYKRASCKTSKEKFKTDCVDGEEPKE